MSAILIVFLMAVLVQLSASSPCVILSIFPNSCLKDYKKTEIIVKSTERNLDERYIAQSGEEDLHFQICPSVSGAYTVMSAVSSESRGVSRSEQV